MDIAVKMIRRVGTDRLGLIVGLERLFQKPVDLVILSSTTDPLLLNEIFTDGEPLYQRETDIFYRWKTFAWHCYMDTQWIRDMQWEWIQRKTAEAA